jgi:hypothetical protein
MKQTTYLATLPNPKSEANECVYDGAVRDINDPSHHNGSLRSGKLLISTGGIMGLRPTQGNEKRLGPATTLYGTVAVSFVIPSVAEGPAVPRTLPGYVFRLERTRISCHAALETTACAAFSKEGRMNCANATNSNRKSAVA